MIKAALFDLDGVVFDTESQYSVFWGMIGKEYHPEIPDFAQIIKGQTLVEYLLSEEFTWSLARSGYLNRLSLGSL